MAWKDANTLASKIEGCINSYDRQGAAAACDDLIERIYATDAVFPEAEAKKILANLRRKRYFELLAMMADAFIRSGQNLAQVRRQYAQALIDQGNISAVIPFLNSLVDDTANDPKENAEAKGLLGRAYKQVFMDADQRDTRRAESCLERAIQYYDDVFQNDRSQVWHGINVVALLCRAERDSILPAGYPNPGETGRRIAARILQAIEGAWLDGQADMWDCGTAAEACVALNRSDDAMMWISRYVAEPYADAFEIASTYRQFIEVWQLDMQTKLGAGLLSVLHAELLRHNGGQLEVESSDLEMTPAPETSQYLEKVLGNTRYMSYKDLRRAFERARCVARIEDQPDHGVGTGFLIRGGDLYPDLGDELVLLTNAHVVSDNPNVASPRPLMPDDATVTFQVLRDEGVREEEYEVELLWTSPPGKLDATILRLNKQVDGVEPYLVSPRLPLNDGEQRVYIIGHPKGGTLSFSIQDNFLVDHEGPPAGSPGIEDVVRLHYRAPTEGGSSGSPVFNSQWKLIGLHHAGSVDMPKLNGEPGHHPANEGIWIKSIMDELKRRPPVLN